ncbi:hypothetical protein MASR2M15_21480 [Anaerolineales bacterium]
MSRRTRKQQASSSNSTNDRSSTNGEDDSSSLNSAPVSNRRRYNKAQIDKQKRKGELSLETIEDALEHPTIFVSEEQLASEYAYVLRDIRNMGILAAVLFIIMASIAVIS